MILVTGGAGFIGSSLCHELYKRGHKLRVLDNLSPQVHGDHPEKSPLLLSINEKVEFIKGTVISESDMLRSLDGVDTVVHFASETGTGQSMYAIRHYSDVNIGGTALLMDCIANKSLPIKKIIVASSRAIYGEGKYNCNNHGVVYPGPRLERNMLNRDFEVHCPYCNEVALALPTDECSNLAPGSIYGITKLSQEQLVLTTAKALGISAVSLRYQNVYGPGQSLCNPYTGILSIFSTRIRNGNDINIFEDGFESRDFVYIDDVVEATVRAVEYKDKIADVINVGSGVATTVLTIANSLRSLMASTSKISISGQFRIGDIRHNIADIGKLKSIFGFKPKVTIDQGLRQFVDWVKGQDVPLDRYEQSLQELNSKGLFK